MHHSMQPVARQSLADDLAQRIVALIQESRLKPGQRLPPIMEMARRFGAGHPTLREALRKLETLGVVSIRHGSGVYVKDQDRLVVSNPIALARASKKQLLDLIEARMAVEEAAIALAARHITEPTLARMRELLQTAGRSLEQDAEALSRANMQFHAEIAAASGNGVFAELLQVLSSLFEREQVIILGIRGAPQIDYEQHCGLLEALEQHDEVRAVALMRAHLEWVRHALLAWDETAPPAASLEAPAPSPEAASPPRPRWSSVQAGRARP